MCGVGRQVEPLLTFFQFPRESRRLKHIVAQLIAHRHHNSRIREAEKKRDVDDAPDRERNVPRQNRPGNHAAADNQSAPPVTPLPDGHRGIHEKDKKQQQTDETKNAPGIGHANWQRGGLTSPQP